MSASQVVHDAQHKFLSHWWLITLVTFVNSRFYENYALFKGATINVVDNGKSSLRFFNTTVVSRAKNKFHLKCR